jgi:hypothetical protein
MVDVEADARHQPADALSLLAEQDEVLGEIFAGWHDSAPDAAASGRVTVRRAFDHGTLGKLLIEHAAVRVAAKRDIERVLRANAFDGLADQLTSHLGTVCQQLDRLDELGRGVVATGVAASEEFADAVDALAATIQSDLEREPVVLIPRIAEALGTQRDQLHSAKHVAAHAPTHPAPNPRWYDNIPVLVRIHARYDYLRGYPWADSRPYYNSKVAERYDDHR